MFTDTLHALIHPSPDIGVYIAYSRGTDGRSFVHWYVARLLFVKQDRVSAGMRTQLQVVISNVRIVHTCTHTYTHVLAQYVRATRTASIPLSLSKKLDSIPDFSPDDMTLAYRPYRPGTNNVFVCLCTCRLGYGISMVIFGLVALVLLGSPRESTDGSDADKVWTAHISRVIAYGVVVTQPPEKMIQCWGST